MKLQLTTALLLLPLLGASTDPPPAPSGSASAAAPQSVPLTAALFAGQTKAPPEEAWKSAPVLSGIRRGRQHNCQAKHVAEWVRIRCDGLTTARVDLLAGEKRDLTILEDQDKEGRYMGENMGVQFSMRPGDRRVIQWAEADLWSEVWRGDDGWMSGGARSIGGMLGMVLQVDWASGPEPVISMY